MMSNKMEQLLSIMIDNLHINNVVRTQLKRNSQRQALRKALVRAYTTWAPRHWEWVDYCFNEHFLTYRATPLLMRHMEDATPLDQVDLANIWAEQFTWFDDEMRQRHIAQLIPAVTNFLVYLAAELHSLREFQTNCDRCSFRTFKA